MVDVEKEKMVGIRREDGRYREREREDGRYRERKRKHAAAIFI